MVAASLKKHEDQILQLNKEQLAKGMYPNGSPTPRYSEATLSMRAEAGNPPTSTNFTLFDSGQLNRAMYNVLEDLVLTIDSDSITAKKLDADLRDRYRITIDNFFGVPDKEEMKVLTLVFEDVLSQIKKLL